MLEGDRQCAKALRLAAMKPYGRLRKRMPFPALAGLKRLNAIFL